ncbi:MAG: methyl-accepting chemotaxis sensory transducer with sensor [Chloroflexi bacterium]|jgi:methyl-accepting chemotaxis protein|nr:methyl-accepting chemotaxis sensory transducer with sensor [Chloroflexota bacterium]
MNNTSIQGQRLLYSVIAFVLVLFALLSVLLFQLVNGANSSKTANQTAVTAASNAQATENSIAGVITMAKTMAGEGGLKAFAANPADTNVREIVTSAALNMEKASPQIDAFYFYDAQGGFVLQQSSSRASSHTPTSGFLVGSTLQSAIQHALQPNAQPAVIFAFDARASAYGRLYVVLPFDGGGGVLVQQSNAAPIFSPFVKDGSAGSLILYKNIVIGPEIASFHRLGELPVTTVDARLDPSLVGTLKQTSVPYSITGTKPKLTIGGTMVEGSIAPVGQAGLQVLSYVAIADSSANGGLIAAAAVLLVILVGTIIGLFFYVNRRLQLGMQASETLVRAKSEALTEDIVAVSQALAVAREGDLTVQIPDSESEVGLLSLSLNGLINDYGQIVGGIVHASQAVQEGAARVDEGVRRIVDVATSQSESVSLVAASVESVASSAVEVQQGTEMATTLAANARGAVNSGQESVGRIAEAVDAIKEAAIGTTREFKRLQEDSIRLTALVASVKSNAENLDMQAANATLEARHLGTESGSAFATNIGRLARQAQDTLADAEGAVRSVVTSIDEVNRRIERISEQVRRGVEEVRTVRTTFDEITHTNSSLVQFIDNVAGSAGVQAQSAQQAARSITEIAQVFEQFTELLITSGDEIANMRLIVASLRESVADLKVDDTALPTETVLAAESAA